MIFSNPIPGVLHPLGYHRTGSEFVVTRDCAGHRATNQGCALDINNGRCDGKVLSVAPGTVSYIDLTQGIVRIDHGAGWRSDYAHMNPVLVKVGQRVGEGQQIGEVGDAHDPSITNFAGCHLHFAINHDGTEVDPWPLLRQNKEDELQLQGTFVKHIINRRVVTTPSGSSFRAGPSVQSERLAVYPAGTGLYPVVQVSGEAVNGDTSWYGAFLYVDGVGYSFGYLHASVLGPLDEATPGDCTAAVASATSALRNKLGGAATAVDGAAQAITAAQARLKV